MRPPLAAAMARPQKAPTFKLQAFLGACAVAAAGYASAQEQVVNLYSARHYATDEALYTNFTQTTGIKINRVDADDAGILSRLKAEGVTMLLVEQNASRALSIADRGYVMESGLVTMTGEARQMLSDPKVRAAYLGE